MTRIDAPTGIIPDSDGRQPTLDFLRGLAILGVVAFHAVAIFNPDIGVVKSLLSLGFQGVQLFFLISALTMCYMWHRRLGESHAALKFYIRRIFRIAPPFWVAIGGYLLLNGLHSSEWAPEGIGARQVITNALFVSGFWPDTINSVVPGGWSIVDEMMFYAFFPFLITRIKGRAINYAVVAFLLYIVNLTVVQPTYGYFLRDYPFTGLWHAFMFFQFFNQVPIFLLGIFLYKAGNGLDARRDLAFGGALCFVWLGLAFALKIFFSLPSSPFFWLGNWMLLAGVIAAFKFELASAPINRIGQLSYSIYLIHFAVFIPVEWCFARSGLARHGPVAFLLGTSVTLTICWVLGEFLARALERPSSRAGKRLVELLRAREAELAGDLAYASQTTRAPVE